MSRAAKTTLLLTSVAIVACGGSNGAKKTPCPTGQHDGGGGICVANGTCSSGYHDGGDSKCTTLGSCSTGYGLVPDGSCARATACPAGTHDNGAGVCVTTITCPTGYHDGGSGTCVPTDACSAGYHDGGNGECWIEGTCSLGYHDGGTGTCVPLVACSAQYHDGGDGDCVADGRCSYGYHDGGDGRCVSPDQCSAGYHDGGGGACTTVIGCLYGYRDDGTGACVCGPSFSNGLPIEMCSCATGFHDDGAGKCVSNGCAAGYHNGGDGTCTRSTICVTGYYVDATGACVHTTDASAGGDGAGGVGAGGVRAGSGGAGGIGAGGAGTGGAGGIAAGGSLVGPDASPTGTGGLPQREAGVATGGARAMGGAATTGGISASGGAIGSGGVIGNLTCGDGKLDSGEACDCGNDPTRLPTGCASMNGIFYGDGKGCSRTCSKEPACLDSAGKNQACTPVCGDGRLDPGEECDDGNGLDSDGCSSRCTIEDGFTCTTTTYLDASTCQSGVGQCLELPIIYRDFQPENAPSGGHPDFPFLGTRYNGSAKSTTLCVPNSAGPSKGNDSTSRCWGIVAPTLLNRKPQPGPTTTCTCQFSDWNIANSGRIQGNYTQAANDSPLSDGAGSYQGRLAGTAVSTTSTGGDYTGILTGYTQSTPGGPIWKGTVPAYKNAASFSQWFNNDPSVNKTFQAILELPAIGTNVYQYASKTSLAQGGFFPLDTLNPSQATLCNLWPYWNHYSGSPFWSTCAGDQYLFVPRVTQAQCVAGDTLDDGCWVISVPGVKHDSYFTTEARYYFAYDGATGISLSFYGDDDLFIFINGILVLDLGGVHQQLPGKVTVTGSPGDAQVTEGGCLDAAGNIQGATAGSNLCSPANGTKVPAVADSDFRVRIVPLGLVTGKVYEMAIFGADRHPPESNYQLTLQGFTAKRSVCQPN